ncbi:hypothetical protein H2199_008894 [Coniosporium tulheliwenetii]|uniref:Uncharacterized protein n=1 Tax=Coniosporium tulheliwenetii TaxID=3383036 RepID=A0ACC2YGV9_9PEZI|nr:hypothetical protein H2199_008894 [Cladosporium sp. JES 115]
MDPYSILGISKRATDAEIRSAYRKLSLKHHPDKANAEERITATENMQQLNEAYNLLRSQNRQAIPSATNSEDCFQRARRNQQNRTQPSREQIHRTWEANQEAFYLARRQTRENAYQTETEEQRLSRLAKERQLTQLLDLGKRHVELHRQFMMLQIAYTKLLPLTRLDIRSPNSYARYRTRSTLNDQFDIPEVHPLHAEWVQRLRQARKILHDIRGYIHLGKREAEQSLGNVTVRIEGFERDLRHMVSIFEILKQEDQLARTKHEQCDSECHYFASEAKNIEVAKAMHRAIDQRLEADAGVPGEKKHRAVKEVAREFSARYLHHGGHRGQL